jgi:hypothetical protein
LAQLRIKLHSQNWQVWEVFAASPPKDAPYDFDYNGAGGTATLKELSYRRRLQVRR